MDEVEKKLRNIKDSVLRAPDRETLLQIRELVTDYIAKYPILGEPLQEVVDLVDRLLQNPV